MLKGNNKRVNWIIGAAIDVHKAPGTSLLESSYQQGLLIKFNVKLLKQGVVPHICGFYGPKDGVKSFVR